MNDTFIHDFCKVYVNNISEESIQKFSSILETVTFQPNEIIKSSETSLNRFYIIVDGILANFSKDKKEGKREYIRSILLEKYAFVNLSSLDLIEKTSVDYYKSLTEITCLTGDLITFLNLVQKNGDLLQLLLKLNHVSIYLLQNRLDRLSLLDATDRYKMLRKRVPNIENLIPQYQIANYLNITPVQLSRIRKKLYSS